MNKYDALEELYRQAEIAEAGKWYPGREESWQEVVRLYIFGLCEKIASLEELENSRRWEEDSRRGYLMDGR